MDMRGRHYNWPKIFWSWHEPLLKSPGNLRFWPKCLNRADGKNSLEAKQIVGSIDDLASGNPNLSHYGLNVVGDIRKASIVNDDLLNWKQVAYTDDVYNWTEERINAFRRAVDKRRNHIYNGFFETLGFEKWL
ncbi:MAG: hypothetical protein FD147_2159 [Chloroflexi bacterium]|nr:MAG: hypothetical protein FD147_2159 [Chloroflexota bacterium]MBA4376523.1 hypothetical protein [Anaerolinea sp.]